ncbi:hypothetical protein FHS01_002897 [Longimicrobium terrae]|nr:hypothetical protein [Longimicrobium terrae]
MEWSNKDIGAARPHQQGRFWAAQSTFHDTGEKSLW